MPNNRAAASIYLSPKEKTKPEGRMGTGNSGPRAESVYLKQTIRVSDSGRLFGNRRNHVGPILPAAFPPGASSPCGSGNSTQDQRAWFGDGDSSQLRVEVGAKWRNT
ncbi:MAG: hypothetical protein DWH82_01245 [Planctomycetota bacterium]|nr:MAG: hypothetical protein DWH82_01245 [Planctomycetota bacterium]